MRMILALALLAAATPLDAAKRATYTSADNQTLVIEVADDGNGRISGGDPAQFGLFRDGHFYLVSRKEDRWSVARMEDVATALGQAMPSIFRDLFGAAAAAPGALRIEPQGKRSHIGREGQIYHVTFGRSETPAKPTEYLVSSDPALKPVGKVLEQFTLAINMMMGAMIGPAVREEIAETKALFALGTPLAIEGGLTLASIEDVDIAHERLELPAKPLTLQEVIAETVVTPTSGNDASETEKPKFE